MKRCFPAIVGLLLFVFASSATASDKAWIEIRSPHFRVFTDGNQSDARQVAFELEQLRYVFASQFPNLRLNSGAPLLVFAAVDENTARSLLPYLKKTKGGELVAGEYFHGWEKQYAMLRLDERHVRPVYHEYVHSILHMNARWLPPWLDEGIAEFYAYTRFENDKIFIGAPSIRAPLLQKFPLIPVEELIASRPKLSAEPLSGNMFYAESWALVHFMTYGPGMEQGNRLVRFFSLLQGGEDQKTAFQQVFGGFKEMDKALERYVRQFAFPAGVVNAAPNIDRNGFSARIAPPAEADAELAAFHIWTHDVNDAIPVAQRALGIDPKLSLAHEDMGYILFSQGQDAAAENEFSEAYSRDNSLYLSLFAKTMLSPIARSASTSDEAQFESALLNVIDLNPQFAPAFVELARLAIRENDLPKALRLSRRAEQLEPGRAGYHLLSGQILLRMGHDADAASFAKFVADRWLGPDHDEAVELWNLIPATQRPTNDEVFETVPDGLRRASGILTSMTCSELPKEYKLVVQSDGKPLTFYATSNFATGFSDTLWYGEDHFTVCHHLEGMRVVVRFRPPSGKGYEGDIGELEIRDSLPAAALNAVAADKR